MIDAPRQQLIDAFTLHQRGDLEGAEQAYRTILGKFPGDTDACHLLGFIAHQRGRNDEAAALVSRAIAGNPSDPVYRKTLGDILRVQGEFDRAEECYRSALSLNPASAESLEGLGEVCMKRGDFDAALEWFRRAIEACPGRAETYFLLGRAFKELRQFDAARACHQAGLNVDPRSAEGHGCLGEVFEAQHQHNEAIACYRTALSLKPDLPAVHNNLGNALREQGNIQEAFACYREALRLAPGHPEIHHNFGTALAGMHMFEEAIAEFDAATALRPDYAEAHTRKASLLLMLGRFDRGWSEYEWRFKVRDPLQPGDTRKFAQPLWDGSDLHGKTILVRSEQGAGDMIQFCRYLAPLKKRGGRVVFECPSRLMRLLEGIRGFDQMIEKSIVPSVPFDVHVPLLSLPRLLGNPWDFQPIPLPYLHAPREFAGKAKHMLGSGGFKIGICWQGNPEYKNDAQRSVGLREFLPLMRLPGVRVYSLQKYFGSEQIAALPVDVTITDLGTALDCGPDAFIETAAVLEQLDLLITTDTAMPHLAGALGRPVWLVVSRVPDWRWLLDRDDSPWYPTMRIFRQDAVGDWSGAFVKVTHALRHLLAGEALRQSLGSIAR